MESEDDSDEESKSEVRVEKLKGNVDISLLYLQIFRCSFESNDTLTHICMHNSDDYREKVEG